VPFFKMDKFYDLACFCILLYNIFGRYHHHQSTRTLLPVCVGQASRAGLIVSYASYFLYFAMSVIKD